MGGGLHHTVGRGAASIGHIGLPRSSARWSSDLIPDELFAEFGERPHILRLLLHFFDQLLQLIARCHQKRIERSGYVSFFNIQ